MKLSLKVIPNSSKNQICNWLLDEHSNTKYLKVKITRVAEGGKANKALLSFLTKQLELEKNTIEIVSGASSPYKILQLKDCNEKDILQKLKQLIKS